MKTTQILILLLAVLTIIGCRKDIDGTTQTEVIVPNIPYLHDTGVSGLVINENGESIKDVIVSINGETEITDENGYFLFSDISINEDGTLLKMEKDGFINGYKFAFPSVKNSAYVKAMMIQDEVTTDFDAATGGIVTTDGASLNFPPNAISKANGASYSGSVEVFFHWYDPTDSQIEISMPGDLRGIDLESNGVQLATYGMIGVELRGSSGEELNILAGQTVKMEMDVSSSLSPPAEIPLWYLDEDSGYWKEEGVAQLVGDKYVAELPHFSFWNCDAPFPLVKMSGTIVTRNEMLPLANARVCLFVNSTGLSASGYTDAYGNFCGKIPKDKELTMTIKDECGNVVGEQQIGPFSEDVNLGTINVNIDTEDIVISGQLLCDGVPVTEGYAKITYNDGLTLIANVDDQGFFTFVRIFCDLEETDIEVIGYNISSNSYSDPVAVTVSSEGLLDLGIIDACANQLDQWVKYKLDGGDFVLLSDITATYKTGALNINSGNDESYFGVSVPNAIFEGMQNPSYLEIEGGNVGYAFCNDLSCSDITFNITSFEQTEGGYVMGTFMGTVSSENMSNQYQIMGDFRVKITILDLKAYVKGTAWQDDNLDGLFNEPEQYLSASYILLDASGSQVLSTPNTYSYSLGFDAGQDVSVQIANFNGFYITAMDQGSDDRIDSDFDPLTGIVNITGLQPGELRANVNVGLVSLGNFECDVFGNDMVVCEGEFITVNAVATGGTAPYNYTWSNGEIGEVATIGDAGNYSVTIQDAVGAVCDHNFFVWLSPNELVEFNVTPASCGGGDGEINLYQVISVNWQATGLTDEILSGLDPGIYVADIVSIDGCSFTQEFIVPEIGGTIGNQVFIDVPGGAVNQYDAGDTGLPGVSVELIDNNTGAVVNKVETDQLGSYLLTNVPAGDYYVKFFLPAGYDFIAQDASGDDLTDSDVDPLTGQTAVFSFGCGDFNLSIDAGVIEI